MARVMIEEYENSPWEELLAGFPICHLHYGLYEVWASPGDVPGLDSAFEYAARFLSENAERLRAIAGRLKNPMRLHFRYLRPLAVNQSRVACEETVPADVVRQAGALGMCIELESVFDIH